LPYRPEDAIHDGIPSAVGCYANFLMVRGLIVVPAYGLPEDDIALRTIEEHAGPSAVTSLECTAIARKGGVLNCVTWTVARPHERDR
jgi:agmatine deiminase